ncbi:hypothetical protein AJ79_04825 [Helicocarpus griseus UAMH5409]|uniref:F-box domain-containing protein n=1 Tax=Helicocarpus griseus UAMH5409 TaxID=1447875 RepID=A0A2B7XSW0_9EURO|nr:hypothetical protein AJ79_04825 [Helicocarpus griseus UAMH5409]
MASGLFQEILSLSDRAPATLEHLPTEIKIEILCHLPDLSSLRTLVNASPDFHSVYRFDRRQILRRLLTRTTPLPNLVEVASIPALRRRVDYDLLKQKGDPGSPGFAKGFLNMYDELRGFCRSANDDAARKGDVDQGRSISENFALSCLKINPFTGKGYTHGADGHASNIECGGGILPLSETEKYRIHRALYRLEMLGAIYTLWKVRDPNYYIAFLKSLPPWEMEEIHCVRNYMYQVYLAISLETDAVSSHHSTADGEERVMGCGQGNRASNRRRMGRRGGISSGAHSSFALDLDSDLAVDDQREHCLTLGLEFLWRWLQESDKDGPRPVPDGDTDSSPVNSPEQQTLAPTISVTEGHLSGTSFFLTRALNPSAMGFFRIIREPQTFTSDVDWQRPNLAWEWLHHMNTKYLCQVHNCYNRWWGYVFWDQARLMAMGLKEEMKRQFAPFFD